MSSPRPPAFDTLSLHAGQRPDPCHRRARRADLRDHLLRLRRLRSRRRALQSRERPAISIPASPTRPRRCWRSASPRLKGASGAVCAASGMAALHLAIATLAERGRPRRRIVVAVWRHDQSPDADAAAVRHSNDAGQAARPRGVQSRHRHRATRLVIGETIGNPGLEVLDIPTVADTAHDAGVPLLIDNTFATPYLSRPLEQGADIVMHSLTKWMGGHGLVIGGVLVDGGRFDWIASGRHATMIEPYAGYHGLVFAEHFGPSAFIMRARGRRSARLRRLFVAAQRGPPVDWRRDALVAHAASCREHGGGFPPR